MWNTELAAGLLRRKEFATAMVSKYPFNNIVYKGVGIRRARSSKCPIRASGVLPSPTYILYLKEKTIQSISSSPSRTDNVTLPMCLHLHMRTVPNMPSRRSAIGCTTCLRFPRHMFLPDTAIFASYLTSCWRANASLRLAYTART